MDDIIDDLLRTAQRCERAAKAFSGEPVAGITKRLMEAIDSVGEAWSGGWVGYHASVYTVGLRPRRPGEHFDTGWGDMDAYSNRTSGEWAEYGYDDIYKEILRRAGNANCAPIEEAATNAKRVFVESRLDLLTTFDAVRSTTSDPVLDDLRAKAEKLATHHSASDLLSAIVPRQHMTRDMRAIQGGIQAPLHLRVQAWLMEQCSYGQQASSLAEIARYASRYLQKAKKMKGRTVAKKEGPIFIGHGRSPAWRDLKDFLVDRLRLEYEEFNRTPVAGRSNKERLLEMLDTCCFAFLVMTGEDEQPDGRVQARMNVIHEAGLFQGRYGFERAIVLLEDGCEEFSNINGVGQIRFPKGNIMAASEEVRRVLEREGIL